MQVKFKTTIERVRWDNSDDYVSNEFKLFCKDKGIKCESSFATNSERNGIAGKYKWTKWKGLDA